MKKWIVALVLVAALAGGGWWWWKKTHPAKVAETDPVVKVERGDLLQAVASDGKVASDLDVDIKCKASGTIVTLPFDVSDVVRKGQLLVELDPVDEQRNVRQAQGAVAASEAKLAVAKVNLAQEESNLLTDRRRAEATFNSAKAKAADTRAKADRLKDLLERKLASREETESAETLAQQAAWDLRTAELKSDELNAREKAVEALRQQVRAAESAVAIDKVSLETARQRLSDTRVIAPMDGVVTARPVQIGQIISSPISNVGGGTTVLTLSDLKRLYVLATVDEADIGKVKLGQAARVMVDAYPGKRFEGKVVRITPRGVNVSNVVTFEVKIEVVSEDKHLLMPEMTSNVEIEIAQASGVLAVPSDALFRKAGKFQVWVQKPDGTKEERVVKVGISDGKKTEIAEGLAEGDTVVLKKSLSDSKFNANRPGGPMRMMH